MPAPPTHLAAAENAATVVQSAATAEAPAGGPAGPPTAGAACGLDLDCFVRDVFAQNPSVAKVVAAWEAAKELYPQVVSLDDPLLGVLFGPGTFGSKTTDFAWRVQVSQKIPWHGKRDLRGEIAKAKAEVAQLGVEENRLRLTEAARFAFFDYLLTVKLTELYRDELATQEEFAERTLPALHRDNPRAFPAFTVEQAKLDLTVLRQRDNELAQRLRVAVARVNTLLNRAPDQPLPSPCHVEPPPVLPAAETLRTYALARRPDIRANTALVRGAQSSVALAHKEFCPDVEVVAGYDAFWKSVNDDLTPFVGFNVNLPVQLARRKAGVREASAHLRGRQAAREELAAETQRQVEEAHSLATESLRALAGFPAVISGATATVDSLTALVRDNPTYTPQLHAARQQLARHRQRQWEVYHDLFNRLAVLERVSGGCLDQLGYRVGE